MPAGQWLKGWNQRIKIVIDKDKIDAALTHFPHRIHLSKASGTGKYDARKVFDELGANNLKIAVTSADGTKQLYVEIDNWDATAKTADLWVSRSNWTISATADTIIYLYYDKTHANNSAHVGVTGSAPAELVWDSNFKLVCHMNDNPDNAHVMDSTSNDNDGTKKGANEPIEASGQIGKAQDGDGVNDQITILDSASLDWNDFTVQAWIYPSGHTGNYRMITGRRDAGQETFYFAISNAEKLVTVVYDPAYAVATYHVLGDIQQEQWQFVAMTFDTFVLTGYINTASVTIDIADGNLKTGSSKLYIGNDGTGYIFDGMIDELQISSKRSSAWVGASYQTQTDNLNLLSLETREAIIHPGAPVPTPQLKRTFLLNIQDWLQSKVETEDLPKLEAPTNSEVAVEAEELPLKPYKSQKPTETLPEPPKIPEETIIEKKENKLLDDLEEKALRLLIDKLEKEKQNG